MTFVKMFALNAVTYSLRNAMMPLSERAVGCERVEVVVKSRTICNRSAVDEEADKLRCRQSGALAHWLHSSSASSS
jgi:hypothetical protein